MSAVNCHILEDEIAIVSDTKAVSMGRTPRSFTSKFHPMPHMNTVMTSTGLACFTLEWYRHAMQTMIVKDVDGLDHYAPEQLRRLWERHPDNRTDEMTTSIFHLGYSEEQERMVGYRYHSDYDFESEELDTGFILKPKTPGLQDLREELGDETLQFLVEAIHLQKDYDDQQEDSDRYPIGGEIELCLMHPNMTTIKTLARFDDYERDFNEMVARSWFASEPLSGAK